jgi:hypothetical protein
MKLTQFGNMTMQSSIVLAIGGIMAAGAAFAMDKSLRDMAAQDVIQTLIQMKLTAQEQSLQEGVNPAAWTDFKITPTKIVRTDAGFDVTYPPLTAKECQSVIGKLPAKIVGAVNGFPTGNAAGSASSNYATICQGKEVAMTYSLNNL